MPRTRCGAMRCGALPDGVLEKILASEPINQRIWHFAQPPQTYFYYQVGADMSSEFVKSTRLSAEARFKRLPDIRYLHRKLQP
uniref:Uncharacterized protein n=1 Tax=Plectus sambesii TaxID=2011161 RepID=A0A914WGJ3_9BILA